MFFLIIALIKFSLLDVKTTPSTKHRIPMGKRMISTVEVFDRLKTEYPKSPKKIEAMIISLDCYWEELIPRDQPGDLLRSP